MNENDAIEESNNTGKKAGAAKERNNTAVANFTRAFQRSGTMKEMYQAQTNEWPDGLVHLIGDVLLKKKTPVEIISQTETRKALSRVYMDDNDDPSVISKQLSCIENQYNDYKSACKVKEDDESAVILEKAPKAHQSVLIVEQKSEVNQLTLDDLRKTMKQHWQQMVQDKNNGNNEGINELLLAAFNGMCNRCHKKGYKASDCPDKVKQQQQGGGKFTRNCNNCGNCGHKKAKGWELKEN